jgi:hypothetical protein
VNKEETMASIFVKVVPNQGGLGKVYWYAMRVSPNGAGFFGWLLPDGTFTQGLDQKQEFQDRRILPAPSAGDAIEMAEHYGWTVINKQAPVEKVALAGKSSARGIVAGILISSVASTIWMSSALLLFGEANGLLTKTDAVANAWIGAVLFLGGPVLILLVGMLPVYRTVGGVRGIVGGLVVGFLGWMVGMFCGVFIQLIFLLFGFP